MPATTSTEATTTAASTAHSLRYAWYVVGVLTLLYAFSFIDRQIFSLLVGPLRRDLHIGDAKMSLLIGFSFALFYTFFGIPLGRLADIYSRRLIIAAGLILWSGFCVVRPERFVSQVTPDVIPHAGIAWVPFHCHKTQVVSALND